MDHSPAFKTIRFLTAIAVAISVGTAEGKRVDRRIQPATGKAVQKVPTGALKGRDLAGGVTMVNGIPLSNGLEAAGGYNGYGATLPGGMPRPLTQAMPSCTPGAPNCVIPQAIQANLNPTPSQPLWPLALQAGMAMLKPMMSGGSSRNSSNDRGDRQRGSRREPIAPGETTEDDKIDQKKRTEKGPIPPGGGTGQRQPPPNQNPPQNSPTVGECKRNGLGLQPILGGAVNSTDVGTQKDSNDQPFTVLKHTGAPIEIAAAGNGNVDVRSRFNGPLIDCLIEVKTQIPSSKNAQEYYVMTLQFTVPTTSSHPSELNKCTQGTRTTSACAPLVKIGGNSGTEQVKVSISTKSESQTAKLLKAPATKVASAPTAPGSAAAQPCRLADGTHCQAGIH